MLTALSEVRTAQLAKISRGPLLEYSLVDIFHLLRYTQRPDVITVPERCSHRWLLLPTLKDLTLTVSAFIRSTCTRARSPTAQPLI